jgi:hypothetical protein
LCLNFAVGFIQRTSGVLYRRLRIYNDQPKGLLVARSAADLPGEAENPKDEASFESAIATKQKTRQNVFLAS